MEFRDEEEERTRFRFRFQQIPFSSRPNTLDFNGCPNLFDFDTLSASNSFDFAFHASNPIDFAVQDSQIAWLQVLLEEPLLLLFVFQLKLLSKGYRPVNSNQPQLLSVLSLLMRVLKVFMRSEGTTVICETLILCYLWRTIK